MRTTDSPLVDALADDAETRLQQQFLRILRTDFWAAFAATVALTGIFLAFGVRGGLWIPVVGMLSACYRSTGARRVRNGDLDGALMIYATGYWSSSLFITWLLPIALPALMFNIIVPVILAATYLQPRTHRPMAIGAVAVTGAMGFLGTMQDGIGIESHAAEWIVDLTVIGFLIGHTLMFTVTVRDANRTRVDALERALSANRALVATEMDLRRSRRRLVDIADGERARIERDLHDGAQQRLVSAAVQLKMAQQLNMAGQAPTTEALAGMHDEVQAALHELRELASGIYPSLLAERGLVEALRGAARTSPLDVTVTANPAAEHDPGDLDQALQVACYFVALEALQNAAKHAGATALVTISLHQTASAVELSVHDDGIGFDPAKTRGSRGLTNMDDRVAALGGTLSVASSPGAGTAVSAIIPRPSGAPSSSRPAVGAAATAR